MREIQTTVFNSERFTDENVLYKNRLIDPVTLSRGLTYLYGKDSEMFPLLSLTDGQKGLTSVKPTKMNDTQYTWNVMGRMKHTSRVIGLANASNTKPGLGFTSFEVDFEDDWLLKFYTVTSPDKQHNCRVQGNPQRLGAKQFRYKFIVLTGDSTESVSLDNFMNGVSWVMGAPVVSQSKSDGTTSNSMAPGKWTNQFGLYRFGKKISGNVANKVVNIEFDTEGGGKTNMWMPFEMKLWEIDRRLMLEEKLWNSKYNRDSNGNISNKDDENGEPLPEGAGIKDILYTTGQYDTYSTLTVSKLDQIVNKIFANRVDSNNPMELVLYTGSGGIRMFNEALKNDAHSRGFYEKLGQEEIMSGKDGWLSYGKYFNQYKTIDGHIITIKRANIFDNGTYAEMDKANGRMFKGWPDESYNFFLLDHSRTDSSERNIQLVAEEGREIITGVYKGLTNLPGAWGAIGADKVLSTTKDVASYEVIVSQGIAMRNYTTSMWLNFVR
jgi:hypothetical protein